MRMPRFRALAPIMVVVMVGSAFPLGFWIREMGRRSTIYRQRAEDHRRQSFVPLCLSAPRTQAEIVEQQIKQYHGSLYKKYDYAAFHPWLPVEPDPPEPK